MLEKNMKFRLNFKDQVDRLYEVMTSTQIKEAFDSRGEDLREFIYKTIDDLQSASMDSGAKNIGFSGNPGINANNVQDAIVSLRKDILGIVAGVVPNDSVKDEMLSAAKGNIKDKVSNISSDLEGINSKLKEFESDMKDTQLKSFETDVLLTNLKDCNGGFVECKEVSGKTEVNLSKFTSAQFNSENYYSNNIGTPILNRTVTVVNTTNKGIFVDTTVNGVYKRSIGISVLEKIKTIILEANETLIAVLGTPTEGWTDANKNDLLKVMVLDGEVKTPPSGYFEGMQSVGQYNYMNGKYMGKNHISGKSYSTRKGILLNDKLEDGVTYTISTDASRYMKISVDIGSYGSDILHEGDGTFTFNKSKNWKLYVWKTNDSSQEYINEDIKIQIEKGTVATGYEDYYEGVKIEILTESENLLNINAKVETTPLAPIPEQYKCKAQDGKLYIYTGASNYHGYGFKRWLNKGEYYLSSKNLTPTKSGYIILNSDTSVNIQIKNIEQDILSVPCDGWYYICFDILGDSSLTNPLILTDIMLTKGTDRKDYKPYNSVKTEILSSQPLTEYDYVDKEGILHLSSYIETYNGSEDWMVYTTLKNTFTVNLKNSLYSKTAICDKYKPITDPAKLGTTTGFYAFYYGGFIISDMSCSTVDDLKNKLKANPITITYQQCDVKYNPIYRNINLNKTLNLQTFKDGYFQCNSGAINPYVTGTYSDTIGSAVSMGSESYGKLKTVVDNKSDIGHTHSDLQSQINTANTNITNIQSIINQITYCSNYGSNYDSDSGLYLIQNFKRQDGTTYLISTLSNKDSSSRYITDTWKVYKSDGTTLDKTVTWTFTYDADVSFPRDKVFVIS